MYSESVTHLGIYLIDVLSRKLWLFILFWFTWQLCFFFGDFLVMIAAITTFVASIVLIFGLKRNAAGMILPWIIINVVDTVGGMSIFIIKVASYKTQVNPAKVTAAVCYFILTIYFVISVNAYYRALRRQKRLALQILKSNSTLNTSGKTLFSTFLLKLFIRKIKHSILISVGKSEKKPRRTSGWERGPQFF